MNPLGARNAHYQLSTVQEALSAIKNNSLIVTAMAAAEPNQFFTNIHTRIKDLKGVVLNCANPTQDYPIFKDPEYRENIEINVLFLTSAISRSFNHDFVQYIPQHLSQWAKNLTRYKEVDVFWGSCSLPDDRGFVSLGPGDCYESDVIRKAHTVILEVNPNIPVTYGSTNVRISEVDHLISSESKLPTINHQAPTEQEKVVGQYINELIPDRATLQLGIGGIPDALAHALEDKRDLGIHTELINDSMMHLFEKGIVTGKYKSIWPNKMIGAFVYGSQELYEFIHHNPFVELHPASVVNDPYRIGRNHKMISVNTAVEIDLTGQVCSESIGHREISGVGGASDTHVGAQRSEGGRGIIAIPSTTKNQKFSKIVFELQPGAKVSISRNDIDTIVTEYGVATMPGKSVKERVLALIQLAHPKFREKLLFDARKANYI